MSDLVLEQLILKVNELQGRISHLERLEAVMGEYGWIGGAWQKQPLLLGYSGDKTQNATASASTGTNTLNGDSVPAGEIWIVQAISANEATNAPSSLELQVVVNGIAIPLFTETVFAAGKFSNWSGEVVLSEGDNVRAVYGGSTSGNALSLRYHAVRIDIDQ